MIAKICLAALTLTSCVAFVFAADKKVEQKADPCAEQYDKCAKTCENEKASCRARGSNPDECDRRHRTCIRACETKRTECEQKAGGKSDQKAGAKK